MREQVTKRPFSLVYDLETSGNCPIRNGVISFAIIVVDDKLQEVARRIWYVRPPDLSKKTWSLGAQGVHGISYEQVSTFMPNDQFVYELLCFLAPYKDPNNVPLYSIFHASAKGAPELNARKKPTGAFMITPWMDYNFLNWCARKARFDNGQEMVWSLYKIIAPGYLVSTVEMSRKAGYKKNRLSDCAERIGFKLNHHEAMSDTECCLEYFKFLTQGTGEFINDYSRNKISV